MSHSRPPKMPFREAFLARLRVLIGYRRRRKTCTIYYCAPKAQYHKNARVETSIRAIVRALPLVPACAWERVRCRLSSVLRAKKRKRLCIVDSVWRFRSQDRACVTAVVIISCKGEFYERSLSVEWHDLGYDAQ